MSYDLLRIFLCSSDLCLQASKEPSAAHPPPMHPLRLSSRAFPVLLDKDRTGDAEPEPGVMCVLRGRGACERPWSNNGWVVVLSLHVPTDPIGSPCADPVLSPGSFPHRSQACGTFLEHSGTFLESFRKTQACETFLQHSRKLPRKLPQVSSMGNVPGTFRNIPRTYGFGRTHPVLHLCS